jgi:dolichol-phosphate mannosyltransferase
MTDVNIPIDTGDFRLMTRRVLATLQSMPEHHRFIRGMVTWIGYKQVPIRYDRAERFAGKTKYPLKKMMQFAIDAITGFSTRPLRVASHAGAVLAVLSLFIFGYVIYGWFQGESVPGWASLMTVVLVLGSANMLFLGILGEYLGRLYMESKGRPLYIIEEIYRIENEREYAISFQKANVTQEDRLSGKG